MSNLGNKKTMSKNIKKYMAVNNVDRMKLSRDLKIKYSTLSDWINEKTYPRIDKIELMANYFNVTKADLIEESTMPSNAVPVSNDNVVAIPIIGVIACGDPILADENIIGYRYHLKDRLPKGQTFYLTAKGDSMEPKIPNGSDVLIRLQNDVEDGEIAAVLVNGDSEATLKRVKKQGDIVMLVAENNAYAPYIVTEHNPARILGKAVGVSFDL